MNERVVTVNGCETRHCRLSSRKRLSQQRLKKLEQPKVTAQLSSRKRKRSGGQKCQGGDCGQTDRGLSMAGQKCRSSYGCRGTGSTTGDHRSECTSGPRGRKRPRGIRERSCRGR